ncbi:hypothetical protein [Lignipirellula cremea]|uniref:Uncharacterized protein n=1 Tax=Lignipirellula cremea TaxID=2528010 RepID=A0A518DRR8_9BACT|nr:hypothetical protein [Lignipirellula cremea]QDU94538.1 hypothetical protein Pla8534_23290 [Lignipirellula cremea]
MDLLRLLLIPLLLAMGWFLSAGLGAPLSRVVGMLPVVATSVFLATLISGITRTPSEGSSVHGLCGHLMLIVLWLLVPFSIGVAVQRNIFRRPGLAMLQSLVLLALLGLTLLTTFTGYLWPGLADALQEERRHRWIVLHLFVLPVLLAVLIAAWYWLFLPTVPVATEASEKGVD